MGGFFDSLPNMIRNGVQISKSKIRENLGFGPLEVNSIDVERRLAIIATEEAKEHDTFIVTAQQSKSQVRHLALKLRASTGSTEWRWFHVKIELELGKLQSGFAGLPFSIVQVAHAIIDLDNRKYLKNLDGWSSSMIGMADPDLVEFLLDWPSTSIGEMYIEVGLLTDFSVLSNNNN